MPALEILSGRVTQPGAVLTPLTMNTGNTLTVRSMPEDVLVEGNRAWLLTAWARNHADGILRIRSPRMHDAVQGIRLGVTANLVEPLIPLRFPQLLFSNDVLQVELSGSTVVGDIELASLLIYYENLGGINGRFISPAELELRLMNILTVENTLALGASGDYTGEEAINSEFDNFKAGFDYAILGAITTQRALAIRYRAPDFGNLGIGIPCESTRKELTERWFVNLSRSFDIPLIPVFSSINKGSVLIDGVQDRTGIDPTVHTILAQLSPVDYVQVETGTEQV